MYILFQLCLCKELSHKYSIISSLFSRYPRNLGFQLYLIIVLPCNTSYIVRYHLFTSIYIKNTLILYSAIKTAKVLLMLYSRAESKIYFDQVTSNIFPMLATLGLLGTMGTLFILKPINSIIPNTLSLLYAQFVVGGNLNDNGLVGFLKLYFQRQRQLTIHI